MTNANGKVRFGRRLRVAREEVGLSQAKFADAVGVTIRGYQFWEYGDRLPSAAYWPAIEAVTDRPLAWFFEEAA